MRNILFLAALLCFCLLVGCTLVTEALRATGIVPAGGGIEEAAKAVDKALGGWLRDLFLVGGTVTTTEGARAGIKVYKKRKARKQVGSG